MRVGCGQITWKRPADAGPEWDDTVLAEIAAAGYAGAPAGMGTRTATETAALFARHGLAPAPGYYSVPLVAERADVLDRAARYAAFMRQLGCTELYVAAGSSDYETPSGKTRREIAGQVTEADAMSDGEFQEFAETLNAVGEATLREGVRACFHNHVGSVIETAEEYSRLLTYTDPALVFLGPDTGHLAWGGADVVPFLRPYLDRIKTLHLKDINPDVLARGRTGGWNYAAFSHAGIFAELGEGFVDFPGLFASLRAAHFDGWLIVETDVTQKATPRESAAISRAYLRETIGV